MSKELFLREMTLSNEDRVSLPLAASTLLMLDSFLSSAEPARRVAVFHLRETCLGRGDVSAGLKELLVGARLMNDKGKIDPQVRAVVLSAVRGDGHALTLVSPYTTHWDRTISDLITGGSLMFGLVFGKGGSG